MSEKRQATRINASTAVAFSSSGDFLFARILNISSSGVFIHTETMLPVDTELALRIRLPEDLETIDVEGRVVWAKHASSASLAGMGIEFIRMSCEHKRRISAFVEERAGEPNLAQCCDDPAERSV